jgi:drug/metabolite transporter superfamily protein YnfA
MIGSNFMQGWVALAGSLAMIALILTAFGLMLGIVKPADAMRRVGAILGIFMLLTVLPAVLVNLWSDMSLWHRLGLAAIVLGVCLLKRPQRESRKR